MIKLIKGDCLEKMKEIPDGSVDMVLTDPPYGTIKGSHIGGGSEWDVVIPFNEMWDSLDRVVRMNGCVALFGQEPFTSDLIKSARASIPFSYRSIWVKDGFANHLMVNKAPLNYYEDINFFFKSYPKYDFDMNSPLREYSKYIMAMIGKTLKEVNKELGHRRAEHFFYHNTTQFELCTEKTYQELIDVFKIDELDGFIEYSELKKINSQFKEKLIKEMTERNPKVFNLNGAKHISNVMEYKRPKERYHPTQKPVDLLEYLIKTYTNEGDTVLDFTAGSGSTGVACVNTNRKFIGIELDDNYFDIAEKRIKREQNEKDRQTNKV